MDQGRAPAASYGSPDDQKLLRERVAELRKSCETVAGWCIGSIVAACLRPVGNGNTPSSWALLFGVLGFVMGMLGSLLPLKPGTIDKGLAVGSLLRAYSWRWWLRTNSILALLLGLGVLLVTAWQAVP